MTDPERKRGLEGGRRYKGLTKKKLYKTIINTLRNKRRYYTHEKMLFRRGWGGKTPGNKM